MDIWIMTDSHLGHRNLEKYCNRPVLFERLIIKNLCKQLQKDDILIHLGDICFGNDGTWHKELTILKAKLELKLWLCRGNHDHKSNNWYLGHGWDFVCDDFSLTFEKKKILFSHKPVLDCGYDLNIHGHFHNSDKSHHEQELIEVKNSKQYLVAQEYTNYKPILLKSIIKEVFKE